MRTLTLELPIPTPPGGLAQAVTRATGLRGSDLGAVVVRRRSLDARKGRRACWVLKVDVFDAREVPPDDTLPPLLMPGRIARRNDRVRPIIVGTGPAGLFAAIRFAEAGIACTVIERGAAVERRNHDVKDLRFSGVLHPESNLCYGEGGAGTYSDGKLYTRKHHPFVRVVYEKLVALGAPREILVDAHPHVGTNRLIPMLRSLRAALAEAGVQWRFAERVDDLVIDARPGDERRVLGVRTIAPDGTAREHLGTHVLFATGHSARDTYAMLARRGVSMQRKDFAIGVRVEHPQALVDRAQLGPFAAIPADQGGPGPAEYFVAAEVPTAHGLRGAYSFCMCPGGFVLPTPTSERRLNVNGMSNAGRNSPFANAALVVQIPADEFYLDAPGDLDGDTPFGAKVAGGALVGVAMQDALERRAFDVAGGGYRAPAMRLVDLAARTRPRGELPRTSFRPGVTACDLRDVLPARVADAIGEAARRIDARKMRGYLSDEAVALAVETTTSAPVRVVRDPLSRESVSHAGLFPCAEGAGYAGGIVSAAIDGLEAAERILAVL